MMSLREISRHLSCTWHTGEERGAEVGILYGCASDLMSDVLAFSRAGALLLTGLVTVQTIQTADIAEISAVVLVRGKIPGADVVRLAREKGMPLLTTPYSMYEASGILYRRGLTSTMAPTTGIVEQRT